jgi:hypothetical protein
MSKIVGFDAKRYPLYSGTADNLAGMVLLAVLVERVEGTLKAYAGIVPDNSLKDPNYSEASAWVKRFGDPLRYRDAVAHWPNLKAEEYAR